MSHFIASEYTDNPVKICHDYFVHDRKMWKINENGKHFVFPLIRT